MAIYTIYYDSWVNRNVSTSISPSRSSGTIPLATEITKITISGTIFGNSYAPTSASIGIFGYTKTVYPNSTNGTITEYTIGSGYFNNFSSNATLTCRPGAGLDSMYEVNIEVSIEYLSSKLTDSIDWNPTRNITTYYTAGGKCWFSSTATNNSGSTITYSLQSAKNNSTGLLISQLGNSDYVSIINSTNSYGIKLGPNIPINTTYTIVVRASSEATTFYSSAYKDITFTVNYKLGLLINNNLNWNDIKSVWKVSNGNWIQVTNSNDIIALFNNQLCVKPE